MKEFFCTYWDKVLPSKADKKAFLQSFENFCRERGSELKIQKWGFGKKARTEVSIRNGISAKAKG